MRSPAVCLAALLSLLLPCAASTEGRRVAFVVGVDVYENLPPEAQLKVAVADAKLMKDTLESLDPPFEVRLVADGGARDLEKAFDAFLDEAKGAECALVYFAGHGVEYHGANFLLVRDTSITDISADVERMKRRLGTETVSLQGWVDSLDSTQAQVKVVILDCCRDNPLKATDGSGTRSVVGTGRGLAQVTPPSGTLISYSADAGQRANDGLFTEVLANNMRIPGLDIVKVFAKTREEVWEISSAWAEADTSRGLAPTLCRSRHEPAEYSKLNKAGTDFTFTRGEPAGLEAGSHAELAAMKRELEMMRKRLAETAKAPSTMARTDLPPMPAFPEGVGMEGSRAGETRTFAGIEMVWCPPGRFMRGSPEDEKGRQDGETRHEVTLTRGFWLAQTEATQEQWERTMGDNPSGFKGAALPVETVSWDRVQAWLAKMNADHRLPEGWRWDLPTEAQWEYACRAGTDGPYAGNGALEEMAWYANSGGASTNAVGKKKANAWGFHDMHGNLWEWCRDWHGDYPNGPVTDPAGPPSGVARVYRGGGWFAEASHCRSAFRDALTADFQFYDLGFRPAVVPEVP